MVQLKPVFKIYLVSNLVNGKVYIGRTCRSLSVRWKEHLSDSTKKTFHFSKAIKKWGAENFKCRIIRRTYDEKQAYDLESFYIELFKSYDHVYGYNSTFGGDGAGIPTVETRIKLSDSRRGSKHPLWNKHRSRTTKKKLRLANLAGNSPVYRHDLISEEIARLYAQNKSLRVIGAMLGADSKTISDRLDVLGIVRRPNWQKFNWKPQSEDKRFCK